MSSYTQVLYQVVFTVKDRLKYPCMNKSDRLLVFMYIKKVIENRDCHVYQINGVEDHLHILLSLHPSVALSDLIKDVKISSHKFIKEKGLFPGFTSWAVGYSAFTYRIQELHKLVNYVKNQEAHHSKETFSKEHTKLLDDFKIPYEEKYLP